MPWSEKTVLNDMHPTKSNDGPILWMRPGEQSIPTIELGSSPFKRRRYDIKILKTVTVVEILGNKSYFYHNFPKNNSGIVGMV